jgi:hypothetical protein
MVICTSSLISNGLGISIGVPKYPCLDNSGLEAGSSPAIVMDEINNDIHIKMEAILVFMVVVFGRVALT